MKRAIAVGAAAILFLAAFLLFRKAPDPPIPPTGPATPAVPSPAVEAVPAAAPVAAPPPAEGVDRRSLLADLARALHSGDDSAARSIVERLRLLLSPPIPDDRNAAIPILKAVDFVGSLNPRGAESRAYLALLTGKDPTDEEFAALRTWLSENATVGAGLTDLLLEAADRPQCRFPPDAERGMGMDGTLVPRLQRMAQFLLVQASIQGSDGKLEAAGENLRAALALSRAVHSDPSLLSQMAGCALDNVAWQTLQGGGLLAAPRVADTLAAMDPASLRESWNRAVLGEAVASAASLLAWKANPESAPDAQVREWARGAQGSSDVAAYVESLAEVHGLGGRPYPEIQAGLQGLAAKYGPTAPEYAALSRGMMPYMPGILRAVGQSEARLAAIRAALELDAYRARRGAYPETLDALGTPPTDPLSGQRLVYRRDGTGFLLELPSDAPESQRVLWRSRP